MKRVLFILGQLSDLDIEWMIRNGGKRVVHDGENIIQQGAHVENLYIILSGTFSIVNEKNNFQEIARIGSGEIVGEMSFIDTSPPSATVTSKGASEVYVLPKEVIKKKLESDVDFAARFYYAIAQFLSHRLRTTIGNLGYGDAQEDLDELDFNILSKVSQAGGRFDRILKKFSET